MHDYQDFAAWQLAQALNSKVYEMTSRGGAARDFRFRDNLRDAVDSAERNFPEGFARFGPREFARFLDHSRASLTEAKNELAVGLKRGYFTQADAAEATILANRALGALAGLQRYLRSPQAEENAKRIREQLVHDASATAVEQDERATDEPSSDEPNPDEPNS